MKKNLTTISVIVVIVLLLGSIAYVSFSLNSTGDASPIVAKKTKAAALTYTRIIPLTSSVAASEPTPTIEQAVIALAPSFTPTPTPLITTEPVIASVEPTLVVSVMPSPTAIQSLPDTGFAKYSYIFLIAASALIVVSFIF